MVRLGAFILIALLLSPLPGLAAFSNTGVPPEGPQSSIRILTLNVMQNSGTPRADRFADIANYLNTHPTVHALALQELSGGSVDSPPTEDSGADLAGMLDNHYGYYTESSHRYEYVLPIFWIEYKVGVMPRYPMETHAATRLDDPSGLNYSDGEEFDGRANVIMCSMEIDGFGRVNLYSTHFYGYTTEIFENQVENLINFIEDMDGPDPPRATIVAGDLNFPVSEPDPQAFYQAILNEGFVDSYPEVNPDDPGYTFGVTDNEFTDAGNSLGRIDYIFVKGENIRIDSSQLVFDGVNGEYVSDHFGVLTEITVVPVPSSLLLLGSSLLGLAGLGYRRRK